VNFSEFGGVDFLMLLRPIGCIRAPNHYSKKRKGGTQIKGNTPAVVDGRPGDESRRERSAKAKTRTLQAARKASLPSAGPRSNHANTTGGNGSFAYSRKEQAISPGYVRVLASWTSEIGRGHLFTPVTLAHG